MFIALQLGAARASIDRVRVELESHLQAIEDTGCAQPDTELEARVAAWQQADDDDQLAAHLAVVPYVEELLACLPESVDAARVRLADALVTAAANGNLMHVAGS